MKLRNFAVAFPAVAAVVLACVLFIVGPGFSGEEPEDAGSQTGQEAPPDAVTTATGRPWERGEGMDAVVEFIMKNRMGFLATVDHGRPRVRAWGFMKYEDGKFYFGTSNTKDVFAQINEAPYAEWISMDPQTYATLRVSGEVVFVDDIEMKRAIIAANPMIKDIYAGEKEKEFELFYLKDIETNWFSFTPLDESTEDAGD